MSLVPILHSEPFHKDSLKETPVQMDVFKRGMIVTEEFGALFYQECSPKVICKLGDVKDVFLADGLANQKPGCILQVVHEVEIRNLDKALQVLLQVEVLRDFFSVHEVDSYCQHLVRELVHLHGLVAVAYSRVHCRLEEL